MAADGTVSLALNSTLVVLLGTVSDLTAKYEDVAAIIAHAPPAGRPHHRRHGAPVAHRRTLTTR